MLSEEIIKAARQAASQARLRILDDLDNQELLDSIEEYPRRPGRDYEYLRDEWEEATWD